MLQCVKEDCAASVVLIPSLKNQPDQPIQFHMQFNTNQLGYAAVGITSGEKMVRTFFVGYQTNLIISHVLKLIKLPSVN